jgi:hypothetical protein
MEVAAQPVTHTTIQRGSLSEKALWGGRIMSGFVTAFLLFDAIIHLLKPAPVVEAFARLHLPLSLSVDLGVVELLCLVLYVIPQTSILGATLLTGYLGGAVAIQMINSNSLFGEILFPVYVGVLVWGGIYLRDERLRTLFPWRR